MTVEIAIMTRHAGCFRLAFAALTISAFGSASAASMATCDRATQWWYDIADTQAAVQKRLLKTEDLQDIERILNLVERLEHERIKAREQSWDICNQARKAAEKVMMEKMRQKTVHVRMPDGTIRKVRVINDILHIEMPDGTIRRAKAGTDEVKEIFKQMQKQTAEQAGAEK